MNMFTQKMVRNLEIHEFFTHKFLLTPYQYGRTSVKMVDNVI